MDTVWIDSVQLIKRGDGLLNLSFFTFLVQDGTDEADEKLLGKEAFRCALKDSLATNLVDLICRNLDYWPNKEKLDNND